MLVFMLSIGLKMEAKADTNTTVTFGEKYSGTVSSNQVNKYSFSCVEAGSVVIDFNIPDGRSCWKLVDESFEVITSAGDYSTKNYATGSVRYVIDLAAGKYEMDLWPSYTGDNAYTISFQFTPANETYKKSNNMYVDVMSEQPVPYFNKITGHFALNDKMDYYKLEVPTKGKVSFSLYSNVERSQICIRNAQDEPITDVVNFGKGAKTITYTLDAGTYYVSINQFKGTGIYYFTVNYEVEVPSNVSVKSLSATSINVKAQKNGNIAGYEIRYKKGSSSWQSITVNGNEQLNKTFEVTPGNYDVQVRAFCTVSNKNVYSQWSTIQSVSCKLKAPTNVKVKKKSANTIKITAKKSGKINGYEVRYKRGSRSWKKVTVKGNKNLNKNIKKLKKGSYKVQVRTYCKISGKNYYSDWSKSKSVKIK